MAVGALMPLIVTVFEVTTAFKATFACGTKLNGSGAVSQASVVTLNVFTGKLAMVNVVVVVVPQLDDAVWRTHTVWLLLIVPAVVTNVAVQPIE